MITITLPDGSTKEYEKSLRKIAMDRQMKMLTKKDKQTLLKLAKLMQKESINESIADEDMKAAKKLKSGLEKQIKRLRLFLFNFQYDVYYGYQDGQDTEFLNHIQTQINFNRRK